MLTPHQTLEIDKAAKGKMGMLTGGPGCGKTYSIAEWIKSSGVPYNRIACMCPTGKAAVRLTESLKENGLPLEAQTIHRALKPQPSLGGWKFEFGKQGSPRWPGVDLIIGDEWSMVDSWLFGMFLGAVPKNAQTIMVGDPNQLPPVGHGKPLRDMIDSGVISHGHLTEPHRFSGRIGQVCKAIQDGTDWEPSPKLDLDADFPENVKHYETGTALASQTKLIDVLHALETGYGMDLMNDVQVLVPVNAKSKLSREVVNRGLQQKLNPDGEKLDGVDFWKGDKVICLKNGVKPLVNYDGDDGELANGVYVANGEMGIIEEISKSAVDVRFYDAYTVRFQRKDWMAQLALAYAVTCHKSQGSQWKVVITMIDDYSGADFVCNRPWIYTALSRASTISITIGRFARILEFLRSPGIDLRVTGLKKDLIEWGRISQNMQLPIS